MRLWGISVIISLAMLATLPTHASTQWTDRLCNALLGRWTELKGSPKDTDTWVEVYERAKETKDTTSAWVAILHLAHLKRADLGLSSFSSYRLRFLVMGVDRAVDAPAGDLKPFKVPKPHLVDQTLGRNAATKILNRAQGGLRNLIWSWGPFGIRGIPYFISRFNLEDFAKEMNTKVFRNPEAAGILGIKRDFFFDRTIKKWAMDDSIRESVTYAGVNKVFMPFALFNASVLLSVAFDFYWLNPITAWAQEAGSTYNEQAYLSDVEKAFGEQTQTQKVALIYHESLLSSISAGGRATGKGADASILIDAQAIKARAGSFEAIPFHDKESFKEALHKASDADWVMINTHGYPGVLLIDDGDQLALDKMLNQREFEGIKLKKGANIVYLACLFSNQFRDSVREVDQENWVRLSEALLSEDGKASASTLAIQFFAIPTATDTDQVGDFVLSSAFIASAGAESVFNSLFRPWKRIDYLLARIGLELQYPGNPRLRIYDRNTQQVSNIGR